jgi:hypothetical protein
MKFANATNLDRKSGEAKWRDLLLLFCPSDRHPSRGQDASEEVQELPFFVLRQPSLAPPRHARLEQ